MDDQSDKQLNDVVRQLSKAIVRKVEVRVPCIVTTVVSRSKVHVKPLIKLVAQDGKSYSRDVIEGVPIFTGGAGDMLISFPVKVGNMGWLEASDRDLSLFLQSYSESEPPTNRMHSFSDSVFVPDIMTNFTVAGEDSNSVVIQNRGGSVKITLDDEKIKIVNNTVRVEVDGSMVTGVAPGGFNLNGFIINADGSASSPVSITAPTVAALESLTVAGEEVGQHKHGGISKGNGQSNAMGS